MSDLDNAKASMAREEREAQKALKQKRVKYADMLAKAEDDLDRWLSKLLRASNQVSALRAQVKRYKKVVQS
jgi:hypothetical protein